jgi:polyisoprenoid-binding protein YceI
MQPQCDRTTPALIPRPRSTASPPGSPPSRQGAPSLTNQLSVVRSHDDREIPVAGIEVASIDTGNADRETHLRSADFFNAEEFATISFRSTNVEASTSGSWAVTGDLTVRDVTRPITLEVDFDGAGASPAGDECIAFSAAAEVNREDWGLTWNMGLESGGVLVEKKVLIELNVQAVAAARP